MTLRNQTCQNLVNEWISILLSASGALILILNNEKHCILLISFKKNQQNKQKKTILQINFLFQIKTQFASPFQLYEEEEETKTGRKFSFLVMLPSVVTHR